MKCFVVFCLLFSVCCATSNLFQGNHPAPEIGCDCKFKKFIFWRSLTFLCFQAKEMNVDGTDMFISLFSPT